MKTTFIYLSLWLFLFSNLFAQQYVPVTIIEGNYFYNHKVIKDNSLFDLQQMYSCPAEDILNANEGLESSKLTGAIAVSPNPANNNALFTFKAAHTAKTSLEVFDMTGKKVADVFMGSVEAGASYNVNYNVSDLATGVYTYRLTNGADVKIERLIINK
jgi:hypothetical protein